MNMQQSAMVNWARAVLDRPGEYVVMDMETTGLGKRDQVIQVALVRGDGELLLDRYIQPTVPIHPQAAKTHGIEAADLTHCPTWSGIVDEFEQHLGKMMLIYNAAFDVRILKQTYRAHGLKMPNFGYDCIMRRFAAFNGVVVGNGRLKWQPLPNGDHTALGDARAALGVIQTMAATEVAYG